MRRLFKIQTLSKTFLLYHFKYTAPPARTKGVLVIQ